MVKTRIFIILIGLLLVSFSNKESYSLTVNTSKLRNSEGVMIFILYNKEGSIPDKHQTKYYKKQSSSITQGSSSITFYNLPKGKYAVNIIHDENNNGEVDKGFILPTEGIGFSKYPSINIRNRPSFSKASFDLNTDLSINVKTIYM
jgi:uncharacterized protein (DUF2141 family)